MEWEKDTSADDESSSLDIRDPTANRFGNNPSLLYLLYKNES
jgi:hypothetical protein